MFAVYALKQPIRGFEISLPIFSQYERNEAFLNAFFNAQCSSTFARFYMLQHMYLDFIPFQVRMVQKVTFRPQQYHMLHTKPSCNLISLDWVLSFRSKIKNVLSWHARWWCYFLRLFGVWICTFVTYICITYNCRNEQLSCRAVW